MFKLGIKTIGFSLFIKQKDQQSGLHNIKTKHNRFWLIMSINAKKFKNNCGYVNFSKKTNSFLENHNQFHDCPSNNQLLLQSSLFLIYLDLKNNMPTVFYIKDTLWNVSLIYY